MTTKPKFDILSATKDECRAEAQRLYNLAERSEASELPKGGSPENRKKLVDRALNMACAAESAAFDGRA